MRLLLLAAILAAGFVACGGGEPAEPESAPSPTATSLPPQPFVPFPSLASERQTDACGPLQVLRERPGGQTVRRVTVIPPRGTPLVVETGEPGTNTDVDWCYDLDVDGTPEIALFVYSGGAHCCITQSIYTFRDGRLTPVLEYRGGNAGGLVPRELDGPPPRELVGSDDRFAYFGELPYTSSPFIAFIAGERGGRWVDVTREFPDVVRGHRDEILSQVDKVCGREKLVECYRGIGLGIYAESLLLRDWERVKPTLPLPAEVITWLELRRGAIEAKLAEAKLR